MPFLYLVPGLHVHDHHEIHSHVQHTSFFVKLETSAGVDAKDSSGENGESNDQLVQGKFGFEQNPKSGGDTVTVTKSSDDHSHEEGGDGQTESHGQEGEHNAEGGHDTSQDHKGEDQEHTKGGISFTDDQDDETETADDQGGGSHHHNNHHKSEGIAEDDKTGDGQGEGSTGEKKSDHNTKDEKDEPPPVPSHGKNILLILGESKHRMPLKQGGGPMTPIEVMCRGGELIMAQRGQPDPLSGHRETVASVKFDDCTHGNPCELPKPLDFLDRSKHAYSKCTAGDHEIYLYKDLETERALPRYIASRALLNSVGGRTLDIGYYPGRVKQNVWITSVNGDFVPSTTVKAVENTNVSMEDVCNDNDLYTKINHGGDTRMGKGDVHVWVPEKAIPKVTIPLAKMKLKLPAAENEAAPEGEDDGDEPEVKYPETFEGGQEVTVNIPNPLQVLVNSLIGAMATSAGPDPVCVVSAQTLAGLCSQDSSCRYRKEYDFF